MLLTTVASKILTFYINYLHHHKWKVHILVYTLLISTIPFTYYDLHNIASLSSYTHIYIHVCVCHACACVCTHTLMSPSANKLHQKKITFCVILNSHPANLIPTSKPLYLQDRLDKEGGWPLEGQHTPYQGCKGHLSMSEILYPMDDGQVVYQDATSL